MLEPKDANLVLRAFIVLGLIGFGFFLAFEQGFVQLALSSDRSGISYLILGIYVIASIHWLWLARSLSIERNGFSAMQAALERGEPAPPVHGSLLGGLLERLEQKRETGDATVLVEAFGDELANGHALGHFLSDVLLRLGLLGTIVGFILMLLPMAELKGFDASMMQSLLTAMSGGMAVALYTTLAGLITSTLLKVQYHMLDTAVARLVTRLAVVVDVSQRDCTA